MRSIQFAICGIAQEHINPASCAPDVYLICAEDLPLGIELNLGVMEVLNNNISLCKVESKGMQDELDGLYMEFNLYGPVWIALKLQDGKICVKEYVIN